MAQMATKAKMAHEQIQYISVDNPPMSFGSSIDGCGRRPSWAYATAQVQYTAMIISATDAIGAHASSATFRIIAGE